MIPDEKKIPHLAYIYRYIHNEDHAQLEEKKNGLLFFFSYNKPFFFPTIVGLRSPAIQKNKIAKKRYTSDRSIGPNSRCGELDPF